QNFIPASIHHSITPRPHHCIAPSLRSCMSSSLPSSPTQALREQCAGALLVAIDRAAQMTAFVGLDGFVDEILHVVDKRESAEKYTRLPTIRQFSERLGAAAGRSTNVELVSQLTKLGGNGPIMANALASFGLDRKSVV